MNISFITIQHILEFKRYKIYVKKNYYIYYLFFVSF